MRHIALLTAFLLLSVYALAGPMNFVEHNFSVEMPSGWSTISPAPRDALLAVQSPGKTQKFLVFASKTQSLVHPDAGREVRNDTKDKMTKIGYKMDPDQDITLGGVPFVSFVAHLPSGGSAITVYTAKAGDQVYMLQAISMGSDAAGEAQLQAAVQSFKLLHPVDAPAAPSPLAHASGTMTFVRVFLGGMVIIAAVMLFRRLALTRRK
jgi:hypothetical protein